MTTTSSCSADVAEAQRDGAVAKVWELRGTGVLSGASVSGFPSILNPKPSEHPPTKRVPFY